MTNYPHVSTDEPAVTSRSVLRSEAPGWVHDPYHYPGHAQLTPEPDEEPEPDPDEGEGEGGED